MPLRIGSSPGFVSQLKETRTASATKQNVSLLVVVCIRFTHDGDHGPDWSMLKTFNNSTKKLKCQAIFFSSLGYALTQKKSNHVNYETISLPHN